MKALTIGLLSQNRGSITIAVITTLCKR